MCGVRGASPGSLTDWLPVAGLPTPTTSTLLPVTFTGSSTGSWTPLPEITPGESAVRPWAEAPPDVDPAPGVAEAPPFPALLLAQALPAAGLSSPTTFTVLPQTFTGTCTGSWMPLPETSPGEPAAEPSAPAPPAAKAADTGSATAIAPDAAATAITPFRVARLIGSLPSRTSSRAVTRTP
ncbi:hypothetical protein QR97_28300 [Streptomyces sp. PBH53]|nr:hypothetical protein QR97_28300 [Streptomyces sp. PBH53]